MQQTMEELDLQDNGDMLERDYHVYVDSEHWEDYQSENMYSGNKALAPKPHVARRGLRHKRHTSSAILPPQQASRHEILSGTQDTALWLRTTGMPFAENVY